MLSHFLNRSIVAAEVRSQASVLFRHSSSTPLFRQFLIVTTENSCLLMNKEDKQHPFSIVPRLLPHKNTFAGLMDRSAMTATPSSRQASASSSRLETAWGRHFAPCASSTHPVFFSTRLMKSTSSTAFKGDSPVAHGYIYQDGQRIGHGMGDPAKL